MVALTFGYDKEKKLYFVAYEGNTVVWADYAAAKLAIDSFLVKADFSQFTKQ